MLRNIPGLAKETPAADLLWHREDPADQPLSCSETGETKLSCGPGEGTKALKTAAVSPELIRKLLDPNEIPATSREMPHRRADCHIIIIREAFRSLDCP